MDAYLQKRPLLRVNLIQLDAASGVLAAEAVIREARHQRQHRGQGRCDSVHAARALQQSHPVTLGTCKAPVEAACGGNGNSQSKPALSPEAAGIQDGTDTRGKADCCSTGPYWPSSGAHEFS